MKTTKEMPKEGQFVAVWEGDGRIISSEFSFNGDVLSIWDKLYLTWKTVEELPLIGFSKIHYITLDALSEEEGGTPDAKE